MSDELFGYGPATERKQMTKLTIEDIRKLKPKQSILIDGGGNEGLFIYEFLNQVIISNSNKYLSIWQESDWQHWTIKKETKKVVYEAFGHKSGRLGCFEVGSANWKSATNWPDEYKRIPDFDKFYEEGVTE